MRRDLSFTSTRADAELVGDRCGNPRRAVILRLVEPVGGQPSAKNHGMDFAWLHKRGVDMQMIFQDPFCSQSQMQLSDQVADDP